MTIPWAVRPALLLGSLVALAAGARALPAPPTAELEAQVGLRAPVVKARLKKAGFYDRRWYEVDTDRSGGRGDVVGEGNLPADARVYRLVVLVDGEPIETRPPMVLPRDATIELLVWSKPSPEAQDRRPDYVGMSLADVIDHAKDHGLDEQLQEYDPDTNTYQELPANPQDYQVTELDQPALAKITDTEIIGLVLDSPRAETEGQMAWGGLALLLVAAGSIGRRSGGTRRPAPDTGRRRSPPRAALPLLAVLALANGATARPPGDPLPPHVPSARLDVHVGRSAHHVLRDLKAAGFHDRTWLDVQGEIVGEGNLPEGARVYRMTPGPAKVLPKATPIRLVVSTQRLRPDLVGLRLDEARRAAHEAGIAPKRLRRFDPSTGTSTPLPPGDAFVVADMDGPALGKITDTEIIGLVLVPEPIATESESETGSPQKGAALLAALAAAALTAPRRSGRRGRRGSRGTG